MVEKESVIYDLVAEGTRKNELIRALVVQSSTLRLEGADFAADVVVIGQEPGGDLKVQWASGQAPSYREDEKISVWFELRDQVYFFKCSPFYVPGGAVLGWAHEDLLLRQSRQDFRLTIPSDYEAQVEITSRDQGRLPLIVRLVDIHSFGLGFLALDGEKFSSNEKVEGILTLGKHAPVKFASRVRFVKEASGNSQVGLAFEHNVHQTESDVQELLLWLRQDVFKMRKT